MFGSIPYQQLRRTSEAAMRHRIRIEEPSSAEGADDRPLDSFGQPTGPASETLVIYPDEARADQGGFGPCHVTDDELQIRRLAGGGSEIDAEAMCRIPYGAPQIDQDAARCVVEFEGLRRGATVTMEDRKETATYLLLRWTGMGTEISGEEIVTEEESAA